MSETQVLIVSHDLVGPKMAGPGIRYWALAQVLSRRFKVILTAPDGSSLSDRCTGLDFKVYARGDWKFLSKWVAWADVVVLPGDSILEFPRFEDCETPLVMDGYDPHTEETLFLSASSDLGKRLSSHSERLDLLSRQCLLGDFFICASEVQRTWWLGLLEAHGRINPYTFEDDPTLRALVDLVPFGLPSEPFPESTAPPDLPGVDSESEVLLWGGGVWEWLDPLTAIRAMPQILQSHPRAKLLFPGTRHPNPGVPSSSMVQRAELLAQALELSEDEVIFGDWVSRGRWNDYLQRADIGLSLHPNTIETKLAFRSRLLEYIWAGLPMVVTRGDETSTLVSEYSVGQVVDFGDTKGVAAAVIEILDKPEAFFQRNFERARESLTWEKAAEPLIRFCEHPRRAPDKVAGILGTPYYERRLSRLTRKIDQMNGTIEKYESGKFMQFMRFVKRLTQAMKPQAVSRSRNRD